MLGIQVAIGALNDVVDAPLDAVAKPRKPIAAGLVGSRAGLAVAGGGGLVGLVLSGVSGAGTLVAGAACLGLGWAYDLRLSRTSLSWLPLALALPLLPIHAWLGAAGVAPATLVVLVPIGVLAGAALALANGIVDAERDSGSGRPATVVRLGRRRAWIVQSVVLAVAAGLAVVLAPGGGVAGAGSAAAAPAAVLGLVRTWGLLLGCVGIALGGVVLASPRAGIRERGWELEAVGVAALGIGWLAGVSIAAGS